MTLEEYRSFPEFYSCKGKKSIIENYLIIK